MPLVEELFLKNKKADYADTYAAIMAIRFHGTEGGVIDSKRLVSRCTTCSSGRSWPTW